MLKDIFEEEPLQPIREPKKAPEEDIDLDASQESVDAEFDKGTKQDPDFDAENEEALPNDNHLNEELVRTIEEEQLKKRERAYLDKVEKKPKRGSIKNSAIEVSSD